MSRFKRDARALVSAEFVVLPAGAAMDRLFGNVSCCRSPSLARRAPAWQDKGLTLSRRPNAGQRRRIVLSDKLVTPRRMPAMTTHQGRHFLQIPGPSPVPDRVLRAMDMPVIDHRSAEFGELGRKVLEGSQNVFQTSGPVVIFPSSGTGAWEAAIVNTLSPGDKVLLAETGQFAVLWKGIAEKFKLDLEFMPGDWRHGADPNVIEAKLAADKLHQIKAVLVIHNETSTSCVTHPFEVRKALNRTNHPALLLVDTISGL